MTMLARPATDEPGSPRFGAARGEPEAALRAARGAFAKGPSQTTLRRNVSAAASAGGDDDPPETEGEPRRERAATPAPRRFSLRRLARDRPLPVLALWLVIAAIVGFVLVDRGPQTTGDLDGLVPVEHRHPRDTSLVLVWFEAGGATTTDDLLFAVDRIHEHFGPRWQPIAAPAAEVEGWLDAHALYLLPVEAHAELVERLGDDSISAAVESLRARLSSPFFGLTGEDARRDPLRLRELTQAAAGTLGPTHGGAHADVTAAGDLVSRDGTAVLLALRQENDPAALRAELDRVMGAGAIRAELVGPERVEQEAHTLVTTHLPRVLAVALAGIALVLALALRRLGPALAVLLGLGSGVALVAAFVPMNPIALPLLVLLAGFSCEGALSLQRIHDRGWPAMLVLGTALAALWLSPYPLWKDWSVVWLVATVVVLGLLRVVLPAVLSVLRHDDDRSSRRFVLEPKPMLAVVVTVATLGAGAWAATAVRVRGAERIDLGDAARPAAQTRLVESFFDPTLVARSPTRGEDRIDVLTTAANDARVLESLVPKEATRVDSPGSLVLPEDELHRRRVALAQLNLAERLDKLGEMLENRGFRPAAFGEFLRAASDPDRVPTPSAALDGPLSRWVERYVDGEEPNVVLWSEVHLSPDPAIVPPALELGAGRRLELFGPAIAGRTDARSLRDWVGIYAAAQLWLAALLVWLGTRSLATSIGAAVAGLVTETGVLVAMVATDIPLTPTVIPALLLCGAAAVVAGARACRAVDLQRPLFAMGLVIVSACQVAAGLALVLTGVPQWMHVGWVAAIGAAIASGAGLFVAPGVARLLRSMVGVRSEVQR